MVDMTCENRDVTSLFPRSRSQRDLKDLSCPGRPGCCRWQGCHRGQRCLRDCSRNTSRRRAVARGAWQVLSSAHCQTDRRAEGFPVGSRFFFFSWTRATRSLMNLDELQSVTDVFSVATSQPRDSTGLVCCSHYGRTLAHCFPFRASRARLARNKSTAYGQLRTFCIDCATQTPNQRDLLICVTAESKSSPGCRRHEHKTRTKPSSC